MLNLFDRVRTYAQHAADKYVEAKTMPERNLPTVIDPALDDEGMSAKLRGSFLRVTSASAGTVVYAVPAQGTVFQRDGGKIQVIAKWGEAAKAKTMVSLGTVEDVTPGIITFPTSKGKRASTLVLVDSRP